MDHGGCVRLMMLGCYIEGENDNQEQLSAVFGAPFLGVIGLGKYWCKPTPHCCLDIDCFVMSYLPENADFKTYTSLVSPVALVPPQLLGLWRVVESTPLKFPR